MHHQYQNEPWVYYSTIKSERLPKLNIALTLVYWNVSCLPVNVASIDCGEVSIWQIPEAAHRSKHG